MKNAGSYFLLFFHGNDRQYTHTHYIFIGGCGNLVEFPKGRMATKKRSLRERFKWLCEHCQCALHTDNNYAPCEKRECQVMMEVAEGRLTRHQLAKIILFDSIMLTHRPTDRINVNISKRSIFVLLSFGRWLKIFIKFPYNKDRIRLVGSFRTTQKALLAAVDTVAATASVW